MTGDTVRLTELNMNKDIDKERRAAEAARPPREVAYMHA